MKKTENYDTAGLIEAQFEPGSRGRVLKNLLGIKRKREMDEIEASREGQIFHGDSSIKLWGILSRGGKRCLWFLDEWKGAW